MVKYDNTYPNNKIMIGENKEENDFLVSSAKDTDIWFHLASFPSCHVILESESHDIITKDMIRHCAFLCKENTKYKHIKKVKIIFTNIKNVKRTTIPGNVILKKRPLSIIV